MKAKHTGDLPKRGMAYGPKLLLPVEEEGGRAEFVGFRLDCDAMEPGTCGTTTRQCVICCVAPPPRFTGEAARVLLDLLRRYDEQQAGTASPHPL